LEKLSSPNLSLVSLLSIECADFCPQPGGQSHRLIEVKNQVTQSIFDFVSN
jgi:hypothetical protein